MSFFFRQTAVAQDTNTESSSQSTAEFPIKLVSTVNNEGANKLRYDERKVVTRFAELTAIRASNEALHELAKDTTWWQTERAVTLYGNLDNDNSQGLLKPAKTSPTNDKFELGAEDQVGQYEAWINFRQNHQCCSSIPYSVRDNMNITTLWTKKNFEKYSFRILPK